MVAPGEVLPISELVVQLTIPDQPLATWTRDHPKARIIMNWVSYDQDSWPTRALITVIGTPDEQASALAVIGDYYGEGRLMRQAAVASSILVGGNAHGRLAQSKPMYQAMMERIRGQLVLYPTLIEKGSLTLRYIIMADVDPGEEIRRLTEGFKQIGGSARLIRFGEYKAEEQPLGDYEEALTPKQAEIVKLALAMGLYDTPRRCTLDTVSGVFGISKAAAHNRMKAAERKILKQFFSA